MEDHLNRSLTLWVYNSEFDVVREVELVPRRGWGGEGALGAVLGYGALHRLPLGLGEEVQAPGENMFESDRKSLETFNNFSEKQAIPEMLSPPAAAPLAAPPMMNPNAPPPSRAAGPRNKKTRNAPVPGFDDMFAEGEKKSAERDLVPSRKGTPSAPPPRQGSPAPRSHTDSAAAQDDDDLGEPGEAEDT